MSDDYRPNLRPGSDPIAFFKSPGEDSGNGTARGHIMAAAIAHALRDGETLLVKPRRMHVFVDQGDGI